jgi:hypothetical protein
LEFADWCFLGAWGCDLVIRPQHRV